MHPRIRPRLLGCQLLLACAATFALGCPRPVPPEAGDVELDLPREAMYVGSYHYLPLRIDPSSGVRLEDLDFELADGLAAGMFSRSRDASQGERKGTVMFGAGHQPGTYEVVVKHRSSGTVLTKGKFEITDVWSDTKSGPSFWFTGNEQTTTTYPTFGGGPSGPQNVGSIPATGTQRLAIVLIDTSSERYTTNTTDLQAVRDRWEDEIEDGVTAGGVTRSARTYYREVSYNNIDLSADVFGPVQLPNTWGTYFTPDASGSSAPQGSFWQSAITAADSAVNYANYDMIVFVAQEDNGVTPMNYAWPYGGPGTFTTAEGTQALGVIVMPQFWGTPGAVTGARQVHQTIAHELGHTLGMGDLYTPGVPGRNLGSWDVMAWEGDLSHLSLPHRMMLGWVQPAWVRGFNFASMAVPVDETVRLQAIETGAPAAGRFAGVEIRIADGWNYYLEYRNGQTTHIGDRGLPTPNRVLGTDVVSGSYVAPIARPGIILLANDADGDGPVLANGTDYEETDNTDPVYPTDFKIDVSGIDGTKADVRIRYGANSRPDPSIRPWPAGPDRQWQSPDIEVRNARNLADPAQWFNVPWEGNPNTVVAKVKNNGTLAANTVVVNFYVKDYTVGNAPETFIGSSTQNIAPGATVEFTSSWTPPAQGHYCVVVRIPLYLVPGATPAVAEMTELNNVAQSNYDRFISRTASPSSREITKVKVTNPYAKEALVYLQAGQSNPLYRTYVEHTWVRLGPNESRDVVVMFEFAGDDVLEGKLSLPGADPRQQFEKMRRVPNDFSLRAMIGDPRVDDLHYMDVVGGVDAQVVEGKASRFVSLYAEDGAKGTAVRGEVQTSDGKPAPDGTVILTFSTQDDARQSNASVPLKGGTFAGVVEGHGWETARAYYLPPPGTADATSPTIARGDTFRAEPEREPQPQ